MRFFATIIVVLLLGYAFLGKGFAYLHVPLGVPLFVGEIALVIGGLAFLYRFRTSRISFRHPTVMLLLAFMLLGVLHTVPYLGEYGISAVRDAAMYYYGAFLIILAGVCLRRDHLEKLQRGVALIGPIFLVWAPLALLATYHIPEIFPYVPGTEIPVLLVKSGDLSIHITTVLILVLVMPMRTWIQRHPFLIGGLCIVALAITYGNRAALLASLLGLAAAFFLRPNRRFVQTGVLVALFIMLSFVFNVSISGGKSKRAINVNHILHGITSIFISNTSSSYYYYTYQDTKNWRLAWWQIILGETFSGPYLLTGRGFGENLALAHGVIRYDPYEQRQLRSPHSIHMTILSRMGVPGVLLWMLVQTSIVIALLRCKKRAKKHGDDLIEGAATFVICYWLMSMINASFDVYLEGPQGAIWFWSIMGFGLALTRIKVKEADSAGDPGEERGGTSSLEDTCHSHAWQNQASRPVHPGTFSGPGPRSSPFERNCRSVPCLRS